MNCEHYQEDFIDYHDGTLTEARLLEIREHLKTCLDCQRAWAGLQALQAGIDAVPTPEPPDRMRRRFFAMLETHTAAEQRRGDIFGPARRGISRWFEAVLPQTPVFQAAAMLAILAGGLWLGTRIIPAKSEPDPEIAELRKQVDSMTRLLAYTAVQNEPASDRVRTMLASTSVSGSGGAPVLGLLNSLALDPNINVRLSALEALYPHADASDVRAGVLAALSRETSPLMQVAMIDFLTAAKAQEAQPLFERISQQPEINDTVRAAARRGISEFL
ncbi:MAG TPA: zf-HC2 domain-containing protein [Opitutaceae bacterium]|nr:zf-HC2 domain-containing protein [Opitutaceae bacterium]